MRPYRMQRQVCVFLQLETLNGSVSALFKHKIITITTTNIWKIGGQSNGDIRPARNVGTAVICHVWRWEWTYLSCRHEPEFVPHDIRTSGPQRQKPPRCKANLRFAHNELSANGVRLQREGHARAWCGLNYHQVWWQTMDRGGEPYNGLTDGNSWHEVTNRKNSQFVSQLCTNVNIYSAVITST